VGFGAGVGSAFDSILEKAIGSAGLLGVVAGTGGSMVTGPPITTPLCRIFGEVIEAILGDCDMEEPGP
jgi:hypothetical protein